MPFLLQRTWTLNEKTKQGEKLKNVKWEVPNNLQSFWTIPENDKQMDKDIDEVESRKTAKSVDLKGNTHNRAWTQQYRDWDRKFETNCYTLDFQDKKPILPKIRSISKAEKLLISQNDFAIFQKFNLEGGVYRSALKEVERKEESYLHKLSVSSKAKIKTRKNIFERQRKVSCLSKTSAIQHAEDKSVCSVNIGSDKKNLAEIQKKSGERKSLRQKTLFKNKSCERWKLKDFYDPLLIQFDTDEIKAIKLKQRQQLLRQFRQIETECEKVDNQTTKYLQIFSRFSQAVDTKLVKKQRKLQKVQGVFQKENCM